MAADRAAIKVSARVRSPDRVLSSPAVNKKAESAPAAVKARSREAVAAKASQAEPSVPRSREADFFGAGIASDGGGSRPTFFVVED